MDREVGRLGYNPRNERYGILVMDLWEVEGLHCGQCFDVYIPGNYTDDGQFVEGHWIEDSIEFDWGGKGWYLVNAKLHGEQLEYVRVSNW